MINRMFYYPAYVLFFSMIFVPTNYQPIKLILLIVILGAMVLKICFNNGRVQLHPSILLWSTLMVATGLFFMFRGAINDAPGALRVGTVFAIWPIVYTVFVAGLSEFRELQRLYVVMTISAILVGIYIIYFLLSTVGIIPASLIFEIDPGQGISLGRGLVEVSLNSTASLLFLVPFLFAALILLNRRNIHLVPTYLLWIAVLVTLVGAMVSGRRAVWLVIATSPFVTAALITFLPRNMKGAAAKKLGTGLTIAVALLWFFFAIFSTVLDLDWSIIWSFFSNSFNVSGGSGLSDRMAQFYSLLRGWSGNPVLGAGLGASTNDVIRSVDQPWAYELFYNSLLFQTGLVGVSLYACGVFWIYWKGIEIIRTGGAYCLLMLPCLVGMTAFLVGSATNPYLVKFDYIWVIFLPVAIINSWLLSGERNRKELEYER